MDHNFVIDALKAAFAIEIANDYFTTPDAIIIEFADHTKAIIKAIKIDNQQTTGILTFPSDRHTYHYQHQNDGITPPRQAQRALGKFQLLSLEDCRSYLDDACQTFFNAEFNDFELTFTTGEVYLVTLEKLEHQNF